MEYTEASLKKIRVDLQEHYDPLYADKYTWPCDVCDEPLTQEQDHCPICGRPIVWDGSKAWKRKFGRPQDYKASLSVIEPETELGEYLCKKAAIRGFANEHEYKRWKRAVNKLDHHTVKDTIDYCQSALAKRGYRRTGSALVSYVLNALDKKVRGMLPTKTTSLTNKRKDELDAPDIFS